MSYSVIEMATNLRDIEWQVGRGRITPVALFDGVELGGASLSRASLSSLKSLQAVWGQCVPRRGDRILVSRRNDIIPKVEALLTPSTEEPIPIPSNCPMCGGPVTTTSVHLTCDNRSCSAQIQGRIASYLKHMGILNWGPSVLSSIIKNHNIQSPADLYSLSAETLCALELNGRNLGTTAYKMHADLHSKTSVTLVELLTACAPSGISVATFQKVFDAGWMDPVSDWTNLTGFNSLAVIVDLNLDEPHEVFQSSLGKKALHFMVSEKALISQVVQLGGLRITSTNSPVASAPTQVARSLAGSSFCFFGFRDAVFEFVNAVIDLFMVAGAAFSTVEGKLSAWSTRDSLL
jgi:hypothetical protein